MIPYEYKCEKCNKVTEIKQSMMEEHPRFIKCSFCGEKADRLYTTSLICPDYMKAGEQGIDYTKHTKTIY